MVPDCPPPLLGRNISLPSKPCSYSSPDRRCFKILSWGQTIFTNHQRKQLLNERGYLWMPDQRILRYQVVLMENPGLTISPCEVFNPATLLRTPEGSLPFLCCLEPLGHWTKFWEGCQKILWPILKKLYTDGSSLVLDGEIRAGYAVVSNFETIEAKPLSPVLQPNWLSS